jgi:ubiquinone/menaquinone biosynthesis C-methylase UbiE
LGSIVNGYRNENLEAMTFPDASIDIVVTQDVLEHVYDPSSVFKEICRVLRPGGAHIFTVPIVNKHRGTQIWATRNDDGTPCFLSTPEYHGNPVDHRGSPVTMHWGYDIVQYIQQASGLPTTIEHIDDLQYGIRAEYIEVLVTRKSGVAQQLVAADRFRFGPADRG